jgi:hypothetical protein
MSTTDVCGAKLLLHSMGLSMLLLCSDREGSSPLYWGATAGGQLLIGTRLSDLEGSNPTATAFPAGCLFTRWVRRTHAV